MLLKNRIGNVTFELLIFFVVIASAIWLTVGIFEATKIRTSLNEISYLAARQIAINDAMQTTWQSNTFLSELENEHSLQNLNVIVNCKNNSCKNGNEVRVIVRARSVNRVFSFDMKSDSFAVSSKFSSDQ